VDWTDTWLEKDWDGSIVKPADWDRHHAERRADTESSLHLSANLEAVENDVFCVEEETEAAYYYVPEVKKAHSLPDPYGSRPPTLHMGEAEEIAYFEKYDKEWETWDDCEVEEGEELRVDSA
jgi:hypothetical protein